MAQDFRNNNNLPPGLRNNNPGNLKDFGEKWQGSLGNDGTFIIFKNVAYGIRALFMDLLKDYGTDGQTTINALITEFAPGSENPTQSYIDYVAQRTGLNPNTPFKPTKSNFLKIARAITEMENGKSYADLLSPADITEGWDLVPEYKKHFIVAGVGIVVFFIATFLLLS